MNERTCGFAAWCLWMGQNMMERVRSINESQEPKISAAFTFSFITLDIYLNNVKVLTLFCPASMYSKNHAWYTYIYIHTHVAPWLATATKRTSSHTCVSPSKRPAVVRLRSDMQCFIHLRRPLLENRAMVLRRQQKDSWSWNPERPSRVRGKNNDSKQPS